MPYMKINHEVDPKEKLLSDLGDISALQLTSNNVLVAVYQRPTTTMLGGKTFYVSDKVMDEDRYQSKVGLIVGIGPTAFVDPEGQWFNGIEFNMHDWIVTPASAAYSMMVNGVMCRLIPDTAVKMKTPDPDIVY